jgi:ADP-ribosylglycohydrolase
VGYVVKSMQAATWAFHDDAGTTGAVGGQLAGTYRGESEILQEWLEGLTRRDRIEGSFLERETWKSLVE